jgi:hypothetical protein
MGFGAVGGYWLGNNSISLGLCYMIIIMILQGFVIIIFSNIHFKV